MILSGKGKPTGAVSDGGEGVPSTLRPPARLPAADRRPSAGRRPGREAVSQGARHANTLPGRCMARRHECFPIVKKFLSNVKKPFPK